MSEPKQNQTPHTSAGLLRCVIPRNGLVRPMTLLQQPKGVPWASASASARAKRVDKPCISPSNYFRTTTPCTPLRVPAQFQLCTNSVSVKFQRGSWKFQPRLSSAFTISPSPLKYLAPHPPKFFNPVLNSATTPAIFNQPDQTKPDSIYLLEARARLLEVVA
jgi:hypothetical protein